MGQLRLTLIAVALTVALFAGLAVSANVSSTAPFILAAGVVSVIIALWAPDRW